MSKRTSHSIGRASILLASLIIGAMSPSVFARSSNLSKLDLCEGLNQRLGRVSVKPVAKPPYLRQFKEPGFGTQVIRISKSSTGSVTKPGRDAAQAWNSDESRMLLHRYDSNGVHSVLLLNGHTYEEIGRLRLPPLAAENIFWSQQDPSILFYMPDDDDAGELSTLNIATGEKTLVKDFAPYCKKRGMPARGGILNQPSQSDQLIGYRCGIAKGRSLAISYNADSDTVSTLKTGRGTAWSVEAVPRALPNGQLFLLDGKIINSKLKASGRRLDIKDKSAPYAIGTSTDGHDMFYQSAAERSPRGCNSDIWNGLGLVVRHDIDERSCKSIVTQTKGYPGTPEGTELAANAYKNPRWLAMASMGYDQFDWFTKKRGAPLLFSEVTLMDASKEDATPCRLAHHRSYGDKASNASYDPTLGRTNISLSPEATRVLFSSDWYDSGMVDTYVVTLPDHTRMDLEGKWVDRGNTSTTTVFSQFGASFSLTRTIRGFQNGQAILVTGSGNITADKFTFRYSYSQAVDRIVNGSCSGRQNPDKQEIYLVCLDDYYGYNTEYTLVKQTD